MDKKILQMWSKGTIYIFPNLCSYSRKEVYTIMNKTLNFFISSVTCTHASLSTKGYVAVWLIVEYTVPPKLTSGGCWGIVSPGVWLRNYYKYKRLCRCMVDSGIYSTTQASIRWLLGNCFSWCLVTYGYVSILWLVKIILIIFRSINLPSKYLIMGVCCLFYMSG